MHQIATNKFSLFANIWVRKDIQVRVLVEAFMLSKTTFILGIRTNKFKRISNRKVREKTSCSRVRVLVEAFNFSKSYIRYLILFYMKKERQTTGIIAVCIIGVITLFFFPEPESNFLAYLGTALFFVIIIIILLRIKSKKKK